MGESRTGAARPAATLGGVRVPDIFASLQADLVDRYRFERELGRGGMAMVYLAGCRRALIDRESGLKCA